MKFLFPTFLFALLAIAIPVIIHLFSFKRHKTVYFSNVEFLKDIKKESKKQSRLKQLLILAARILTIIFLVFAFAQPYIPTGGETQKQPNQLVAVYVDNSFSMNAISEQGQLLEVARNKALEICLAYPAGTKFRLFTNDLKPIHQHVLNKEQFINQVSEIQATPAVISLSMIYNRFAEQQTEDAENTDKNLYFISDFQRTITDIDEFEADNIFSYYLPLVPNEVANLYIDSCWVEVPAHRLGQEETIYVSIKNSSNQDYQNLPIKMFLNDSLKSITNFSVEAQENIVAELKYNNNSSGLQMGRLEITDYPFTHDNNWYISYKVDKNLKALAIYNNTASSQEGLQYIDALFENDDYVLLDQMNVQNLQVNRLGDYNTIFLVNLENYSSGFLNELETVVGEGTSVVIFPEMGNNTQLINNLLSRFDANQVLGIDSTIQEIAQIEYDNAFYKNVFKKREENPILPEIKNHLRFENATRSDEMNLLAFQNGDKALSQLSYGDGKVWTFSFPINTANEDFANDVLFVPTLYNFVLNSLPKQEISLIVGKNNFYDLPGNIQYKLNAAFEIENLKTGDKIVPNNTVTGRKTRLEFGGQIASDGHYLIENDGDVVASMAFNYNRQESDLRYYSEEELQNRIDEFQLKNATVVSKVERNFSEVLDELQNGKQLWKLMIILALFFILVEALLARFWK
ncbi:BatA domain-containing protein [Maribellus mangrovi]|uniref:BatA domain-containing protein n=1 Tax=Maribellus mangrovi TaxID=3133146 RepID=UPI0030EB5071